jgi:hypothetical protein
LSVHLGELRSFWYTHRGCARGRPATGSASDRA